MDWRKIGKVVINTVGAFGASFMGGLQLGIPPREAAIMAGIATGANLFGLNQDSVKLLSVLTKK